VIWEPFLLALVLGIIVSAGLYFAYLWPSIEPIEPVEPDASAPPVDDSTAGVAPAPPPATAASDDAVSSAP
jgi:hypothetical protein